MEIYSVFVIVVAGGATWEVDEESTILTWDSELSGDHVATDDFLLGTFSSPEEAEKDLKKFLPRYKVDHIDTDTEFNENRPIRGITLWKTELDVGQAKGEFVKWMRGDAESLPVYPYA